jgi:Xaa-Pro aminopeptidase
MILGSGPNGAIIHYRAEEGSSAKLDACTPILCDTGAQYLTGTTDTTRTFLFQEAKHNSHFYSYLKEMYTRVLMGNLDLQTAKFPYRTYGNQLEGFARRHLWSIGKDFKHGVGHGVSFCGPVHEYPHFAYAKKSPLIHLQPHMTITNEPGYYEEGQFGIRIENIMVVDKVLNNNDFLCFRPLTLVPYCSRLIQKDLLEKAHQTTVSTYYT